MKITEQERATLNAAQEILRKYGRVLKPRPHAVVVLIDTHYRMDAATVSLHTPDMVGEATANTIADALGALVGDPFAKKSARVHVAAQVQVPRRIAKEADGE